MSDENNWALARIVTKIGVRPVASGAPAGVTADFWFVSQSFVVPALQKPAIYIYAQGVKNKRARAISIFVCNCKKEPSN
jgi:hypothetical protein